MSDSSNKIKNNVVELRSPDAVRADKGSMNLSKKRVPRAHFFRGKLRLFGHYIHARFIYTNSKISLQHRITILCSPNNMEI